MEKVYTPEFVSNASRTARSYHLSELRNERKSEQLKLIQELASNPIVELIAGIAAITYLNKGSQSWLESITGIDLKAGGEYAGLIAIIGLQQLAANPAGAVLAGSALKSLPALLAL